MIEPSHTGISYSFTDDGFWESAYYQALPNRTFSPTMGAERSRLSCAYVLTSGRTFLSKGDNAVAAWVVSNII